MTCLLMMLDGWVEGMKEGKYYGALLCFLFEISSEKSDIEEAK